MAAAASTTRVALVTGANKGIGFATVKALAADSKLTVLLGSRDVKRGEESVKALGLPNVLLQLIDVTDEKSIIGAAAAIKAKYGGLDILINNAGIAWKGDAFNEEVARGTIGTNYYGSVLHTMKHFLPSMKENGRVVNVSSMMGAKTLANMSAANREKFLAPDLTETQLTALVEQFITDVKNGDWEAKGWTKSTYGLSKTAVTMLTRIVARDNKRSDLLINSMCPGWVKTDMAGDKAPKTPDQGAETPVHLALLPVGTKESGLFWENKKVSKYF